MAKFKKWIAKHKTWISGAISLVLIAMPLWASLPEIKVMDYRPTALTFFLWTLTAGILFPIADHLANAGIKQALLDQASDYNEQIIYLKDLLFNERREVLNDALKEMATALGHTMQERICVYRYLATERGFDCLGRYSVRFSGF